MGKELRLKNKEIKKHNILIVWYQRNCKYQEFSQVLTFFLDGRREVDIYAKNPQKDSCMQDDVEKYKLLKYTYYNWYPSRLRRLGMLLRIYCWIRKDIAQSMGRASREHLLRNFTWDKVATNTVEVFSSVLNRKGCRNGE